MSDLLKDTPVKIRERVRRVMPYPNQLHAMKPIPAAVRWPWSFTRKVMCRRCASYASYGRGLPRGWPCDCLNQHHYDT